MQQIISDSKDMVNGLCDLMQTSCRKISTLIALLTDYSDAQKIYANRIQSIAEKYHEDISKDPVEQDQLVFVYQFVSNYLLNISHINIQQSKYIFSEIIEPYQQFFINYRQTNEETLNVAKIQIKDLEKKRQTLIKMQEDYWKMSQIAENSSQGIEKAIEEHEKGFKSPEKLQKAAEKQIKTKIEAEEAMNQYKMQIGIVNRKLEEFNVIFQQYFQSFNYNDESRISFTRQTIQNFLKQLTINHTNQNDQDQIFDEKLKELEDRLQTNISINSISLLNKGKSLPMTELIKEEFLSFENWKLSNNSEEVHRKNSQIKDSYLLKDKKNLEILVNNLLDPTIPHMNLQLMRKDSNITATSDQSQSQVQQQDKSIVQSQQQSQSSSNTNNGNSILMLAETMLKSKDEHIINYHRAFKKSELRFHFLQYLHEEIINKQIYYLKENKFDELSDVFKLIIQILENDDNTTEEQYLVLLISTRLYKEKNSDDERIMYLSYFINDSLIWFSFEKWSRLFDYIRNKKFEENKKIIKLINSHQSDSLSKKIKQYFSSGNSKSSLTEGKEDSDIDYLVLEELNSFLINLELKTEFPTDLIINLAKDKSIKLTLLPMLLEKQETKKNNELRNNLKNNKMKRENLQQKLKNYSATYHNKCIFSFKKALIYLNIKDKPWILMTLSKQYKQELEKKIYKYILARDRQTHEENMWLQQNRIAIWCSSLKAEKISFKYAEMKSEVALNMNLNQIEDIISLDVARSMHLHLSKINSSMLQSLLRTFAFYNKEINYCQGMNYIAGFLYLLILDEEKTYKMFHCILNKHFYSLFINNFDNLKLKFYQLERLLNVFLPDLMEHFKNEKIYSQYYATPWFITIFASSYQYTGDSFLTCCIWDMLHAEGWKGFLKCVLFILNLIKPQLMKLSFDEILRMLGDLIKSELFTSDQQQLEEKKLVDTKTIKKQFNSFAITNKMLENLETEYNYFIKTIEQKLYNDQ